MENKNVGYLLLGISLIIIFIIFLFNNAMKSLVIDQCGPIHGPTCEMNKTIEQQTYLALAIVGVLVIVGFILIFSKTQTQTIVKTRIIEKRKPERKYDLSNLKPEERTVFELVKESKTIFQADLIEKTKFGKAKMTRIIDRLEGRGLVERKRRGMTNVVVLK